MRGRVGLNRRMKLPKLLLAGLLATLPVFGASGLKPGVRGVATHAPEGMKIDGDLSEWKEAFSAPGEYFNPDLKNRACQFFYMWDDEAFYAAYRALDEHPANNADDAHLWEGDAVEWYFDTRRGDDFRGKDWGKGAVHCYWTGLKGTNVNPRFCLRPGYLDAIPKIGVEVGAKRTAEGMTVEFKLPWANFPEFKAAKDAVHVFGNTVEAAKSFQTTDKAYLAQIAALEKQVPAHEQAIERRRLGLEVQKQKASVDAASVALDEKLKALEGEPEAAAFGAADDRARGGYSCTNTE